MFLQNWPYRGLERPCINKTWKFKAQKPSTRRHAPRKDSAARPSNPTRRSRSARSRTCHTFSTVTSWMTSSTRATRVQSSDVIRDVTIHYGLTRFDPDPNRQKKKKKKREREKAWTKQTFDLDQKLKIFKTDLSHSIFRVHSDFGTRFFIRSSEIVQTSNFQKKLTFVQMLTKKSKFSKRTCPTQFFEYILISGPVSSFKVKNCANVQFPKSWLLCKCWPNVKIFKMDLSYSIFRVHSNFGVHSVS